MILKCLKFWFSFTTETHRGGTELHEGEFQIL
jgi:hypothetical protein